MQPRQIGAYLARLRKGRGLNQTELAVLTGLSQPAISDLERGYTPFTRHYASLLAPAFDKTASELERETGIIADDDLTADADELKRIRAEHPDLMALLARLKALSPEARIRFNGIMRKVLEFEEEFAGAEQSE